MNCNLFRSQQGAGSNPFSLPQQGGLLRTNKNTCRPILRRLRLREFISRSRLRLLRSENNFFLHVNELSKIIWNTCTSMYIDPILFYFYSRKDIMLKLKLEPEPGQSYGSGSCSSQIPRLRAAPAPKPCMII